MLLYVLVEDSFNKTNSGGDIFKGLKEALRKKRIQYQTVKNISEIEKTNKKTFLIVISNNLNLIINTIAECEVKNVHPIIISLQFLSSIPGIYSSVTPNIDNSLRSIMHFLKKHNRTAPALYGISVNSAPDMARKNCFLNKQIFKADEADVYHNHTGLEDCFKDFYNNIDKYDCVICTNNYVAIHLVNKLRELEYLSNQLKVIAYGRILMASNFYPEIIQVYTSNESFGKAAITIFEALINNTEILHMNLSVKSNINDEQHTVSEPLFDNLESSVESSVDIFYEDSNVQNMILVEKLLNSCDSTDMNILDMIVNGASYDEISAKSFLSYSAVKYRIRRMIQVCNCNSKSDFVSLVKDYIA